MAVHRSRGAGQSSLGTELDQRVLKHATRNGLVKALGRVVNIID